MGRRVSRHWMWLLLGCLYWLGGCGQKGPLHPPPKPGEERGRPAPPAKPVEEPSYPVPPPRA